MSSWFSRFIRVGELSDNNRDPASPPPLLNGLYKSEVWEWRFDSCISKLHRHDSQSVNQKFKTHLYSAMMVSQANQRRETAWTMSSVHCKHKQYQTVPSLTYTDSANDVRSTVSNSLSADVRHHPEYSHGSSETGRLE